MCHPTRTSWTLINGAAAGERQAGESFMHRYTPVVRAYLRARWQNPRLRNEIEDAIQDVFIECFKQGGVLSKADQERPGGFRAFFYGVVRNVAQRFEAMVLQRPSEAPGGVHQLDSVPTSDDLPLKAFEKAWARAMMREASALQAERALSEGDRAVRRVEILRLRFQDGKPIRAIARLWNEEPDYVHHEYATARMEFEAALKEVLAGECGGEPREIERLVKDLLDSLA